MGHAYGVRVQKVQKVQRVQRVVVAASPQVVYKGCVRFAQGATAPAALKVADCPTGNAYKVSVTGFTFGVIWYDRHSGD